jgi:hypothetical protein
MKFKVKNDTEFFRLIDEMCEKNQIQGPNSVIKNYDYYKGYMVIELSDLFVNRLKEANKDDYDLLISDYSMDR